jgi:hypothetical protein
MLDTRERTLVEREEREEKEQNGWIDKVITSFPNRVSLCRPLLLLYFDLPSYSTFSCIRSRSHRFALHSLLPPGPVPVSHQNMSGFFCGGVVKL